MQLSFGLLEVNYVTKGSVGILVAVVITVACDHLK